MGRPPSPLDGSTQLAIYYSLKSWCWCWDASWFLKKHKRGMPQRRPISFQPVSLADRSRKLRRVMPSRGTESLEQGGCSMDRVKRVDRALD